jgi:hypothetical protein
MKLTAEQAEAILYENAKVYRKKTFVRAAQMNEEFTVETHEGTLTGQPGDYLVQNRVGDSKPWPVKKSIFEETYERVFT